MGTGMDKRKKNRNQQAKQARRAARKSREQKHRRLGRKGLHGLSKNAVGTAPVRDAFIGPELFEDGIGPVVITRDLRDGQVAIGVFLVDVYCLGVKNAFFRLTSELDYDHDIAQVGGPQGMDKVEPACARKLVEGAVAYARDLGFVPHPDFREAGMVLGDIDGSDCPETFAFGKDGKPLFIRGPHDSSSLVKRIVAQLRRRCGEHGFHYIPGTDDPDELEGAGRGGMGT